MAWSPVDTRLRILPQAVVPGWTRGLEAAVGTGLATAQQRRLEAREDAAAEAQRGHELGIEELRAQAAMDRLQAEQQAIADRLQASFGHERGLFDRRAAHELDVLGRTQRFQADENRLDREHSAWRARMDDALRRYVAGQQYELGLRGLSIDAIRAGAQAQEAAARIAAMGGGEGPFGYTYQELGAAFPEGLLGADMNEVLGTLRGVYGPRPVLADRYTTSAQPEDAGAGQGEGSRLARFARFMLPYPEFSDMVASADGSQAAAPALAPIDISDLDLSGSSPEQIAQALELADPADRDEILRQLPAEVAEAVRRLLPEARHRAEQEAARAARNRSAAERMRGGHW